MVSFGGGPACLHSAATLDYYSYTERCKEQAVLRGADGGRAGQRPCILTNTTTETPSLCCVVSTLGKKIGMKSEGIFGWPELVVSDLRL